MNPNINPDREPITPEIRYSDILRDIIFEHLPAQARRANMGALATFWPNGPDEMVLRLRYNPEAEILDICASESIYGPDGRITGAYVRACELGAIHGEILAFDEYMQANDVNPINPHDEPLVAAENDISIFDGEKLDFFLTLFANL